jgi:hypothetical protein
LLAIFCSTLSFRVFTGVLTSLPLCIPHLSPYLAGLVQIKPDIFVALHCTSGVFECILASLPLFIPHLSPYLAGLVQGFFEFFVF